MTLTFQQVKEDLYNYYIHESIKEELLEKSRINTRLSQTYSDMPKGDGGTTDSVSNEVFRRMMLEIRIKRLNARLEYIDESMCVLNELEKKVIDYIKKGFKMTRIAILLSCPRRKIVYTRDKAIEKIREYANEKVQICSNEYYKC